MSARAKPHPTRRLQAWLLTGPLGHLLGGGLDLLQASGRHLLTRMRGRVAR